jgi:hypothetical protein
MSVGGAGAWAVVVVGTEGDAALVDRTSVGVAIWLGKSADDEARPALTRCPLPDTVDAHPTALTVTAISADATDRRRAAVPT